MAESVGGLPACREGAPSWSDIWGRQNAGCVGCGVYGRESSGRRTRDMFQGGGRAHLSGEQRTADHEACRNPKKLEEEWLHTGGITPESNSHSFPTLVLAACALSSRGSAVLHEGVRQQLGHMLRANWGQMLELMAAACTGSDDDSSRRLCVRLLNERLGDFERKRVLLFQRAKCASHSATTGIEQCSGATRQTRREPGHESGFHERLGVAMGELQRDPVFR